MTQGGGSGGNQHQGGGRKYNDNNDHNNRRTYDMMSQNSGNQVSQRFIFITCIQ